MARPSLTRHRKFRHLSRLLGGHIVARGVLELVWEAAYDVADDVIGTDEDVENAAYWHGEAGVCVKALLTAGFLDHDEDGTYRVHHLWDHCPDYVRKRAKRTAERVSERRESDRTNGIRLSENTGQMAAECPDKRRVSQPSPVPTQPSPAHLHGSAPPAPDLDAYWQTWRQAAEAHGHRPYLTPRGTEAHHLATVAGHCSVADWQMALQAWWASPHITSRTLGFAVSQLPELLAYVNGDAGPQDAPFRAPPSRPAKPVLASPPDYTSRYDPDWRRGCTHEPKCTHPAQCARRAEINAVKAEARG